MRITTAFSCIIIVLSFVGCGTKKQPTFDSPWQLENPLLDDGTREEIYHLLKYRTPDHPILWTRADVRMKQRGESGTMWFDATLIYRDPDAVRLRGSRIGIGTLFEVIVSGDRAWVHLKREKELYGGTLEELRREGGILGSFSLQDMMAAILVNHDLKRRMATSQRWKMSRQKDEVLLIQPQAGGSELIWRIRRLDGLVSEMIVRDARGREELKVEYLGYELIEGEPLPTGLVLHIWGDALTIEVDIEEYKIESGIDPQNVDYLPSLPEWPLRALRDRESVIPVEEEKAGGDQ